MKKIIITYKQILDAANGINTLMNTELPYLTGLKLQKTAKTLNEHMKDYQEEEAKLVDKYFEKDENGNLVSTENGGYKLLPDTIEEYIESRKTLDDFEMEVTVYPIDFDEISNARIKPVDIPNLEFLIDLPDDLLE